MKKKIRFYPLIHSFAALLLLKKLGLSYLEPGSSSFLLKILISSLVGLVVFFRQILGYIRLLMSKLSGKKMVEAKTAVSQPSSDSEV